MCPRGHPPLGLAGDRARRKGCSLLELAAGDLGKLLQRHAKRIMSAEAWPAEIAIRHSPRTAILAFGEEEAGWPFQSERDVYRALWRHQMPVDFDSSLRGLTSADTGSFTFHWPTPCHAPKASNDAGLWRGAAR